MQADHAQRVVGVVEGRLVELVVLLVCDIGLLARPDGDHGVDGLALHVRFELRLVVIAGIFGFGQLDALFQVHLDGVADVVAVAANEVLQLDGGQVAAEVRFAVFVVRTDVQDDVRAAVVAFSLADAVAFDAVAFPLERLVAAVCLAHDGDFVGDHECRVEADAELADDVDFLSFLCLVALLELQTAGMRDGTEVLLQLFLRHANAVVAHRDRALFGVDRHADLEVLARNRAVAFLQGPQVDLVERVGRVRDELAQEYLLVRVNGIDHEVKQALAFGLELLHVSTIPFSGYALCWLAEILVAPFKPAAPLSLTCYLSHVAKNI